MAVKRYKPTTPGRRRASVEDYSDITKKKPERSLTKMIKRSAGRNNTGQITVRHRGGGAKRLYRMVDFARTNYNVRGEVVAIEYDPFRGPRIALVQYDDGTKAYILAAAGMKVGDTVVSTQDKVEATVGTRMQLQHIPIGMTVYNAELEPGKGGQIVRGAGASAQLQTVEGKYAQLKLPSGEVRLVLKECLATVGKVGNSDYQLVRLGKAGRMRHRGRRPVVKGRAMNPVDHPHGGGEGKTSVGLKSPKTKWGKKAYGVKTRKRGKASNALIVKRRKKKK